MGWVLKLRRRPDPELTDNELGYLAGLLDVTILDYTKQMNQGLVSKSVLRSRYYAQSVRGKIKQVIES